MEMLKPRIFSHWVAIKETKDNAKNSRTQVLVGTGNGESSLHTRSWQIVGRL